MTKQCKTFSVSRHKHHYRCTKKKKASYITSLLVNKLQFVMKQNDRDVSFVNRITK